MRDHWQTATLGDLSKGGLFTDGDWVESKDQDQDGDNRLLQLADVGEGVFLNKSDRWMNDQQFAMLNCTPVEVGDILIARMPDPIARACQVPENLPRSCVAVDVAICRLPEDSANPKFLVMLVNDWRFRSAAQARATGTTRKRISRKNLASIEFELPPLIDQRRIVDLIGSIDNYIDALQGQIDATRTARDAVTADLIASLHDVPSKSLADLEDEGLIQLGRGHVISKKDMEANPGDFPVYSSAAKNNGMIGSYGEYMFDEELITWSVDGGGHLFHRPRHKFSVTNIGGYLRISDTNQLSYGFLCAALQRLHSRCHFDWQHKAHPSVIRYEYSDIPIPTIGAQREIESTIQSLDSLTHTLQVQIDAARGTRSGVLSELLSGDRLLDESYDKAVGW